MSAPNVAPHRTADRWLRPSIVLPFLAVVLTVTVLLTPQVNPFDPDQRLTTYSTGPNAAGGLYEIASRLGWRTARARSPLHAPLDTDAVFAVLNPPEPLSSFETHLILDAVRRGGGLVYVVGSGTALDDSLKLRRSDSGYAATAPPRHVTDSCPNERFVNTIPWFQNGVHLYRLIPRQPLPADTAVFVTVDLPTPSMFMSRGAAVLGVPVGRGRVVAYADPDLLRNDVIRMCRWGLGVPTVKALDWVSGSKRRTLVFDEFHQGFGSHPGTMAAIWHFLVGTPEGRMVAEAIVAALILILALGPRPIAPRDAERIERRSPLEHVGALARAYEQVSATRVAARQLARGLRRRHGRGAWSGRTDRPAADADERFLVALAASHPAVAKDTERVLAAERRPVSPEGLLAVADAVDRIDQVFSPLKP